MVPETTQYNFELTDYDDPYAIDLSGLSKTILEELEVDKDNIDLEKSADEYEKNSDTIMEAIRSGNFVYDVSGSAR